VIHLKAQQVHVHVSVVNSAHPLVS